MPLPQDQASGKQRTRIIKKTAGVSALVNLLMSIIQLIIGVYSHSQALVADSLHTLSDLCSDGLVYWASAKSNDPADLEHPYGHRRIETAVSLLLGAILMLVGGVVIIRVIWTLYAGRVIEPILPIAFWTALLTLVIKELLFRYLFHVGTQLNAKIVIANAWHARSDAISSLIVAVGIGGSLLGWTFADLVASIVLGGMIAYMGYRIIREGIAELIDTALDEEYVSVIEEYIYAIDGVRNIHQLRTRKMAHEIMVDVHVEVDHKLSVSEGHYITTVIENRLKEWDTSIAEVMVHIDAEDDDKIASSPIDLTNRKQLEEFLQPVYAPLPKPHALVIHYIDKNVHAELQWLASDVIHLQPSIDQAIAALRQRLNSAKVDSLIEEISIHLIY